MKYPIKFESITPKTKYYSELVEMYQEASDFLLGFIWCKQIKSCKIYLNLGSKITIFLFEIENSASIDDNFLWIIVGDLPPMYLVVDGCKSTHKVLECYVELAEDWISQIKQGKSIDECYPFEANPTIEMAELLERRASFIKNTLIENVDDLPFVNS